MNDSTLSQDFQQAVDERARALAAEAELAYRRQMQCVFPRSPRAVVGWRPEATTSPPVWERPAQTERTLEHAKGIIFDLQRWAAQELRGSAGDQLVAALDDLRGLLVTGCTDVDQSLQSLASAVHVLKRWQGRGDIIGNVKRLAT